jgi:phage shock protein PspC (stress-responsive transcriptional regulator)
MDPFDWLFANLGLVLFTVICVGLIAYLVWVMINPERV